MRPREAFRTDLAACIAAAAAKGIDLRSFVFPRDSVDYLDVLEEEGFTAFRGHPADRPIDGSDWQGRLYRLIDTISPRPYSAGWPSRRGELLDVPQTYFFDPNSDVANRLGGHAWSWLARRRLTHAVRMGSLFHVWFHPHNLATHPDWALRGLDNLFREASHQIEQGRLENLTMGALADRWIGSGVG